MQEKLDHIINEIKSLSSWGILLLICCMSSCFSCMHIQTIRDESVKTNRYLKVIVEELRKDSVVEEGFVKNGVNKKVK